MAGTKLCIVTDIHYGPDLPTKKGEAAAPLLDRFVRHTRAQKPDLVLELGDRISDVDAARDRANLAAVAERFAALDCDVVHLLGNHDVCHLHPDETGEILGCDMGSRVVDLGRCRLVVWQPDVRIAPGLGFPEAAPSLAWLVDAISAGDTPAIVLSHVPLSGHSQIGNYYFERNPRHATFPDHALIRSAVEATGKVALWLAGHVHWNTVTTVGGIPHVTVQSLTESFTTPPEPCGAFADLDIGADEFTLTVHGLDPFGIRLPFRASGGRPWTPPLAPFSTPDIAEPVLERGHG